MSTTAQPHTWEQAENILLSFVEQSFSTKTFNGSSMGKMCSSKKVYTAFELTEKISHFIWISLKFWWAIWMKDAIKDRDEKASKEVHDYDLSKSFTIIVVRQQMCIFETPIKYTGYNRKDLLSIDYTTKVYLRALFLWEMRTE